MFSVRDDDPFIVFQTLQDIARKRCGERDVMDLSRGDPGYGFTPSMRGRSFASLILHLDTVLNRNAEDRFLQYQKNDLPEIEKRIDESIAAYYQPETATVLRALLGEFMRWVIGAVKEEGLEWTPFEVYRELFAYCAASGGSYLRPQGQLLTRIMIAAWHRREYDVPITSDDLILTSGASHAIGTIFNLLGEEGRGYLTRGSSVLIASPSYSPYNRILDERGIVPITFTIDPFTGILTLPNLQTIKPSNLRALILINPHNPTGFSLSQQDLRQLANIARKHNTIIVTDEVYYSLFGKKETMLAFAPERTIAINARSKVERSTGLRSGEIIILPEARSTIAALLGLSDGSELMRHLLFAKAPGRAGGQFQHTTFVPGPSQLLSIAHIALGEEERRNYIAGLQTNHSVFCSELSIRNSVNNLYYLIFDLDNLPGCTTRNLPMEERLIALAEAGVVYIPAYRFFSDEERQKNPSTLTAVRASVVNTTPERLKEAARRTKEVLC